MKEDYVYLNVPSSLGITAWILLPGDGGKVPDHEWSETYKKRIWALTQFFCLNHLLAGSWSSGDWEKWVLRMSDFTEEGRQFVEADYVEKWHAAWDRNPTKDPCDVKYLALRLRQMREANGGKSIHSAARPGVSN